LHKRVTGDGERWSRRALTPPSLIEIRESSGLGAGRLQLEAVLVNGVG
jgi:hypothetical protein